MAVTSSKPKDAAHSRSADRTGKSDERAGHSRTDENRSRSTEKSADGEQPRRSSTKHILGGTLAFVALAVYFIWLGKEMGGATPTGSSELAGIFAAILLAVLALAGGALLGRNRD